MTTSLSAFVAMRRPEPARPRILVVDQEFVIAATLRSILNRQGCDAISFTNAGDALEAAKSKAPHLLICDMMMRPMTGMELAVEVRRSCHKCKVLLYSSRTSTDSLLQDVRRLGLDFEFVDKTVHPGDFLMKNGPAIDHCEPVYAVDTASDFDERV